MSVRGPPATLLTGGYRLCSWSIYRYLNALRNSDRNKDEPESANGVGVGRDSHNDWGKHIAVYLHTIPALVTTLAVQKNQSASHLHGSISFGDVTARLFRRSTRLRENVTGQRHKAYSSSSRHHTRYLTRADGLTSPVTTARESYTRRQMTPKEELSTTPCSQRPRWYTLCISHLLGRPIKISSDIGKFDGLTQNFAALKLLDPVLPRLSGPHLGQAHDNLPIFGMISSSSWLRPRGLRPIELPFAAGIGKSHLTNQFFSFKVQRPLTKTQRLPDGKSKLLPQ